MTTFDSTIGARVTQIPVNFSGAGDTIIIPGVIGKLINILQFFLVFAGDTNLTFKSAATAISGPISFLANGSFVLDYLQLPLSCNPGDNFVMNLSAGVQVSGTLWYSMK